MGRDTAVYVVGCCDTKKAELVWVVQQVRNTGLAAVLVDVSTQGPSAKPSRKAGAADRDGLQGANRSNNRSYCEDLQRRRPPEPADACGAMGFAEGPQHPSDRADIGAQAVAACHPGGQAAVFTGDRGSAVAAMGEAFERFLSNRDDIAGVIGLGGSGGTAIVTQGMRALPIGTPRIMVSTVAAGNVSAYVGPNDIAMVNSITDIAGLNRISRTVLLNAVHAMAGMVKARRDAPADVEQAHDKPALGLTMFGVTTPCITLLTEALAERYECVVFHATGIGGQSMEKLARDGFFKGVFDITTTEVCDLLLGGILPATPERFGFLVHRPLPYVGSCGALDMVNFGAPDSVPLHYRQRKFYQHNPQVTLMRTTAEENAAIGRWIGERLNRSIGPVCFLLPEAGVSLLDAPDQAFWNPEADQRLFQTIEQTVQQTDLRRVIRVPHAINSPEFAQTALHHMDEIVHG